MELGKFLKSTGILEADVIPELIPYIREFIVDRIAELKLLEESLALRDFEEIRRMAHKWKGICAPYGFATLGELGAGLEEAAVREQDTAVHFFIKEAQVFLETRMAKFPAQYV
ncbi:MAG: Hpt domain-containing protein [Bdellovibrionales bacterium]